MSVLEAIVRASRGKARALAPRAAALERAAAEAGPPRAFAAALVRGGAVAVVAEYKRRSPSAGPLAAWPVEAVVRGYAAAGVAALSVLTEGSHFGGALEDLAAARAAVPLPVLRKDFLVDPVQVLESRAAGADAVLVIVRIVDDVALAELLAAARALGMDALVEVHTAGELERALRAGATLVGVNARDLATLRTDLGHVEALAGRVPGDRVLVAESGIGGRADVERMAAAGADAVLVGESLLRVPDPSAAAAALVGVPRRRRAGLEVKICGVCRPEDAAAAANAGADYVGVVLAAPGPRRQEPEAARRIFAAAGCRRVGVFADAPVEVVVRLAHELDLAVVQLHGDESAEVVAAVRRAGPWQVWKALRPQTGAEVLAGAAAYAGVADALLLDGRHPQARGGAGVPFPWDEVASVRAALPRGLRLGAAGGLTPENVAAAVARLDPDLVDVSSGVEATLGEKSAGRIRAFVAAARAARPARAAAAAPARAER